jgi:putative transposase
MFKEIAEVYDITIEEMEVSPDHVHLFCSFPPRYSIAQVVTRFKSLSARAIFREFPQVKRQLWVGEFWEDGYFARTVGDKVTADVIRKYIQRHKEAEDTQISLFFAEPVDGGARSWRRSGCARTPSAAARVRPAVFFLGTRTGYLTMNHSPELR